MALPDLASGHLSFCFLFCIIPEALERKDYVCIISYHGDLYVQPILSQKKYAERSDRLLLVFYSRVLTGERCVILFEELNLMNHLP